MNDWIDARKELPPKDIKVLIFDGTSIEVAEYSWDTIWEREKKPVFLGNGWTCDWVEFWMKLPDMPKKEKDERVD